MDSPTWTALETASLLYFSSRGVCLRACQDLVGLTGGQKSAHAVQSKFEELRRVQGLWNIDLTCWNIQAVDEWLRCLDLRGIQLCMVTSLDAQQEFIVTKHHPVEFRSIRSMIWNTPLVPTAAPKITLKPQDDGQDLGGREQDLEIQALVGAGLGPSSWRI